MSDETVARGRRPWGALLVVAALAVVPYFGALESPFVFDDLTIIEQNRIVLEERLGEAWTTGYWYGVDPDMSERQALYRPLTVFSYAVSHAVFGLEPGGYRLVNILLHGIAACLLFALLRTLLEQDLGAFLGASIFAVHPIHTEAVTYISGRADLIAGLGFLCAWWLVERSCSEAGRRRLALEIAAATAFFLGLLGKEMAATLPFLVLSVAAVRGAIEGPRVKGAWSALKARARGLAWLFGALAIAAVLRVAVLGKVTPDPGAIAFLDNPLRDLGFFERLDDGIALLGRQLALLVWPVGLSIDYSYAQIPADAAGNLGWIVLVAFTVLVGVVAAWFRWVFVPIAIVTWILVSLPISNIPVVIGTILGERTLFLPSMALALFIGGLFRRWTPSRVLTVSGVTVFGILIGAGAWGTYDRNRDYGTTYRLWESAMLACPDAARAAYNYSHEAEKRADALQRDGRTGLAEEERRRAVVALERTLEIYPDYVDARYALARRRMLAGDLEKAREDYLAILESRIQADVLPDVLASLADAYLATGQAEQGLAEITRLTDGRTELGAPAALARGLLAAGAGQETIARAELERAIQSAKPKTLSERRQLARALGELGLLLERSGEPDEARQVLERAVSMDVDLVGAHLYLVGFFLRQNALDEAQRVLEAGEQRFPGDLLLRVWRARLQMSRGELGQARDTLEGVLDAKPGDSSAQAALVDLSTLHYERGLTRQDEPAAIRESLESAEDGFERALASGFSGQGLPYRLAVISTRLGRWREAIERLEAIAAKHGPNEHMFLALIGERWLYRGNVEKARAAFERAGRFEDGRAAAAVGLARCNLPSDPVAAEVALAKSGLPEGHIEREWAALLILEAGEDLEAWSLAAERFRSEHPEDPRGALALARLATRSGEPGRALELAREVKGARPGDDVYWQLLEVQAAAAAATGNEAASERALGLLADWAPERP